MIKQLAGWFFAACASFLLMGVSQAYDCSTMAPYAAGTTYATGAEAQNGGHAYQCLVGGWCTVGGPYAPGTGWASSYAWKDLGACATQPPPDNPPPDNPPSGGDNPPPAGHTIPGVPAHVLVGYWHNFENGSGFIPLSQVSGDWNVVEVAFAVPTISATDGTIGFTPYDSTDAAFTQEVDELHARGQKVLISIGGADGKVELDTTQAEQNFVTSMIAIITKYHFDGMDIDFEGQSLHLDAGDDDFEHPTTPVIVNTINAIRQIHDHFGQDFILTMAPETFFVQLGHTFYGGACLSCDNRAGAFLPIIYNTRDILSWLQVQDYNSGPITGLDGQYHMMGGADFHVAMLDMLLHGFSVAGSGETFPPLRPDQVVLGVPASALAGNGYVAPDVLEQALDYIVGGKAFGNYVLRSNPVDNAAFRGVMAWSINWDAYAGSTFSQTMGPYVGNLP